MNPVAGVILIGASGTEYFYTQYPFSRTRWHADPANYAFACKDEAGEWQVTYIGETDSLLQRMRAHSRWNAAEALGCRHVLVKLTAEGAVRRRAEERDLIAKYQPPLNTQHIGNLSFSSPGVRPVCNNYAMTASQKAILEAARAMKNQTGNLPLFPGIFPDYPAPIVRGNGADRELVMARWGMPSPKKALEGKKTDPGVTNVRNTPSPHWRRWLAIESRCLVPFTSFAENEVNPDGSRPPVWFALDESRPLAFFAGIWTTHTSVRKLKEGEVTAELFAFLTINPNAEVGAIHPKAMPVILTKPEELEAWLTAPAGEALKLQRPLPDGALKIVARGSKKDGSDVG